MSLPPAWVSNLFPLFSNCYSEAAAAINGYTGFEDPERHNILPHFRRAVCEAKFRKFSEKHGLNATVETTEREESHQRAGHDFTLIKAGRIRLTLSKTDHPSALPATAVFRKQHCRANDMLIQQNLFQLRPLSDQESDAELIYAIVTHGPQQDGETLAYVNLGFPKADFSDWHEPPVSIFEIQDRQTRLYQKPTDMQADSEESRRKATLKPAARKPKDGDEDKGIG